MPAPFTLPEQVIKADAKKKDTKGKTGIELEVSKMGVLGGQGMSEEQRKAIERMLKTLNEQGL